MSVDTDTRLIAPSAARARRDHPASKPSPRPVSLAEDAHPIRREHVGRHRKPEEPRENALPGELNTGYLSRQPVGPEPESWMPGEGPTARIPTVEQVAPMPLPQREAGRTLHSAGDAGLLAVLLEQGHKLRQLTKFVRGAR